MFLILPLPLTLHFFLYSLQFSPPLLSPSLPSNLTLLSFITSSWSVKKFSASNFDFLSVLLPLLTCSPALFFSHLIFLSPVSAITLLILPCFYLFFTSNFVLPNTLILLYALQLSPPLIFSSFPRSPASLPSLASPLLYF